MALTREFKETVQLRANQDPEYRKQLIIEATNCFLSGDIATGKTLLRDYLNATEALPDIAIELSKDEKSIRRMIGPKGNPTLENFINLLGACRNREGIDLKVAYRNRGRI
jgi:hypothetical protein